MTPLRTILVVAVAFFAASPVSAKERTYYIAADQTVWNYAPSGSDVLHDKKLTLLPKQLGLRYHKVVFHAYTDGSFATRTTALAYMGLVGPPLHVEVGDTLRVVFKNNARIPLNFYPHGLVYAPNADVAVGPGGEHTYTFNVPERSGPGPHDGSSIVLIYQSNVDNVEDVNTGLFGPIVVTRKGSAREDGSPSDVDREVFATFAEMDESVSRLAARNTSDPAINTRKVKGAMPPISGDNQFYTINGFVSGNMPIVDVRRGERTRWYLTATMSDYDVHTPHWHGETALVNGMRTDAVALNTMGTIVADMVPDNPGTWLFHCHVDVHLSQGMAARFRVLP